MKPSELHPTAAGLGDDDGRSAYQPGRRPRRRSPSDHEERTADRARRSRANKVACRRCGTPVTRAGGGLCNACGRYLTALPARQAAVRQELIEPFQRGCSPQHEHRVRRLHAEQARLPL